jgi:hypothetical protein
MLASLISADFNLFTVFAGITFSFLATSVLLCLAIVLRRIWRNKLAAQKEKAEADFRNYIALALRKESEDDHDTTQAPKCQTSEMANVLLHYFRTLRGEKLEYLQEMISGSEWEKALTQSTFKGIRGVRMRCLRTLSYLKSQRSLQVIFDNLSSQDKYVRLTAARCLVRRKSFCYLGPIIESLKEAFPQEFKILAGILAKFGLEGVELLEGYITRTTDSVVKTACLEALILIMPAKTSLDFAELMADESNSVRAAALSLSEIAGHSREIDPLRLGLKDEATSVKMRAVKMAYNVRRTDLTADLYKLANDPVMWVRYWALRAIWVSGQAGQKFVATLAQTQTMAEKISLEMRSGFV